jgi:hypothetical protein
MIWNNIRQLASGIIIPISLKKPVNSKLGKLLNPFFIMRLGIFQDIADYEIWKNKSVEQVAIGKKAKYRSAKELGVRFFKIIIPLEIANKYDSEWLSFVREIKNDEVKNKKEYFWKDTKNLTDKQRLQLFDIDILKKNLRVKEKNAKTTTKKE